MEATERRVGIEWWPERCMNNYKKYNSKDQIPGVWHPVTLECIKKIMTNTRTTTYVEYN